ncbi:SCP2 sterol-binding domain-containing protein [Kangiella sp.]|uniref:ubiquinone biosynthesis accessory factor UbiJ n=1 Tax=Kangiella sp. TaxID=1920245 RepID=UPI0019A9AA2C|nr:SCP2 sterol-binding domain-containing protein [Kangiella sp.]MBD3652555.1 SCP2 sterol-binding domain-containing protein [Kangiella sp.]
MMLSLFTPAIEMIINQAVKLDPDAQSRLASLEGKIIKVTLTDLNASFYIVIEDSLILVKAELDKQANAELTGSSSSFFNLALNEKGSDSIFKGEVHFAGEIGTAQNFQNFFKQLDIDWEEHLAKYTGDIVAHQLISGSKTVTGWLQKTVTSAQQNLSEYIRFEAKLSPASIELENFYDAIADLKSDSERLKQKVERLSQKLANREQKPH